MTHLILRILKVLSLVSHLLVISSLMYLEMSRKGAELAFSSRITRVSSEFQKTVIRLLKVSPYRLALRVLKMLYFM